MLAVNACSYFEDEKSQFIKGVLLDLETGRLLNAKSLRPYLNARFDVLYGEEKRTYSVAKVIAETDKQLRIFLVSEAPHIIKDIAADVPEEDRYSLFTTKE